MPWPRVSTVLAASALVTAAAAQADVVKPARGAPIVARVWDAGADEVTFNVYRTSIRKVTHGTQKLPAKAVKQVVDDPDPHRAFWRKAEKLQGGTADDWHQLGVEAAKNQLRGLARLAFVEALVREPAHAGALAMIDTEGKKQLASDRRANPQVREQLAAYLAAGEAKSREAMIQKLQGLGCDLPAHYLERALRSAQEKKGRTDDRLLTLRGNELKGVYTLFVPPGYDPLQPTPLLVALHGGGAGGRDGKAVIGSGTSAMGFYQAGAARQGYIVVCPTALASPWSDPRNEPFLLAVVDEITMLFNVDRNRIYLTGHSMGGYGAWHYGQKFAHLWAAIAPMAVAGGDDLQRLRSTLTGVYLYHGADDNVVGPEPDREAADRMRADGMDFVYAEIPDSGHSLPDEVLAEMWEFFSLRRLAIAPGRAPKGKFTVTEEPASSFLDKPGKEETAWFGALGKDATSSTSDVPTLLKNLELGGGLARTASEQLARVREPGVGARVAAILVDPARTADSRRFAAEALGGIGDPATAKALQKALGDPDLAVVGAAALALGSVPNADTCKRYAACLLDLRRRFTACMVGSEIDFSDFRSHLATVTRLVEGATRSADAAKAAVVAQAAGDFLLPAQAVRHSERAGEDPAVPRRQLAKAVLEGCRACPVAAVKATLETLAARPDLGVAAEAKELLGGSR